MLSGANQQIITAFEDLEMTPDQISEEFGWDTVAVKATLMQFSTKYRQAVKEEPSLDFDVNEQLEAKQAMIRLMRSSEDDHLVARMACRIRDDAKGRLDGPKIMSGLNINVTVFNQRILQAREAKERSKALTQPPAPKVIDVQSEKHQLVTT